MQTPPDRTPYAAAGPNKLTFLDDLVHLGHELPQKGFYKPDVMPLAQTLLNNLNVLTLTKTDSDIAFVQGVRTFLPHFRTHLTIAETELANMNQADQQTGSRTRDVALENAATILRQLVPMMESIALCSFAPKNTAPPIHDFNTPATPTPERAPITIRGGNMPFGVILGGKSRPSNHRLEAVLGQIDLANPVRTRPDAL